MQDLLFANCCELLFRTAVSHFSNCFTRLLAQSAATQSDISATCGIPRGTISLYASAQRGISVNALEKLLTAFPDVNDQLDLVIAHLHDETPPSHGSSIRIEPAEMVVREDPPKAYANRELEQAIELLRTRALGDQDLRNVILDLERFAR